MLNCAYWHKHMMMITNNYVQHIQVHGKGPLFCLTNSLLCFCLTELITLFCLTELNMFFLCLTDYFVFVCLTELITLFLFV